MEFQVLGSVRIVREDGDVVVLGPLQRILLAVLPSRAGHPVLPDDPTTVQSAGNTDGWDVREA